MDKLTPKQERFVNEYIRTLNVTQSAIQLVIRLKRACIWVSLVKEETY